MSVYLINVHLMGVHVAGVHLMGMYLMGVYLMGVRLMGVYLAGVHLTGVYLAGVHLMGMYLIIVHLMGVYLIIVHLTGVHLVSVHLTGVHLVSVHLAGVHLTGLYLTVVGCRDLGCKIRVFALVARWSYCAGSCGPAVRIANRIGPMAYCCFRISPPPNQALNAHAHIEERRLDIREDGCLGTPCGGCTLVFSGFVSFRTEGASNSFVR
jgi:hypothetical protein